jgi:hypothetical protein
MAVIIPLAAQANTSRLRSPAALAGVPIAVIASSTSCLRRTPAARRRSFFHDVLADAVVLSTSPKIDTSTIARGDREHHPVGDPGRLLRTLIREESLDGFRDDTAELPRDRDRRSHRMRGRCCARIGGVAHGSAFEVSLGVVGLSPRRRRR